METRIVSRPDFNKISKDITKSLDDNIKRITKHGAHYLISILPSKTNKLKQSIEYDNNTIWTTSDYYRYVDEGTKPHRIEGLLVFQIGGATIFSFGVDHPGTKAQKTTEQTVDYIVDKINRIKL